MTTSLRQDLAEIALTETAKLSAQAAGADLPTLLQSLDSGLIEAKHLLDQILRLHPSDGGDAENFEALQALMTKIRG